MIWALLAVVGLLVCLVIDPEFRCLMRGSSGPAPGVKSTLARASRPGEVGRSGVFSGLPPGRTGLGKSWPVECHYFAESQRPSRPASAAIPCPNEGV
jgi:hypothetical protein